jgi:serine/threonine protein kinase
LQEYPHIPLCHDFSSNLGPECPSLEEDYEEDFHFRSHGNVSSLPSSLPSSSSQSQSPNLLSSPAVMFLSAFTSPQQSPPNPDHEGQIISGYTLGAIIGYGGTSIIRKASSTSGDVVAVKIIRHADLVKAGNAPQARRRLEREASIWSTLSHEHILPLFFATYTPHTDYFFTLYCPVGSLFDILKRDGSPALTPDDVGTMFRQVVRGLRYLHESSRLVHRDMKLENVLVDEMGMCRISDFGMSRFIGSDDSDDEDHPAGGHAHLPVGMHRAVTMFSKRHLGNVQNNHVPRHRNSTSSNQPIQQLQPGSLPYAAPELLLPQTSGVLHPHPRQDIWALGVMLYTLLTGRFPFADSFEPRLQMKILKGVYEIPQDIGRGAEQILRGCLEKNISDRWNIAMVDDVAWGVGEGDDATQADPDEESDLEHKKSHPRARPRPGGLNLQTIIDWEQDERSPSSTSSPAPSSPTFSLERGRRPTKFSSESPSSGFIPSTPPYGRVSSITGFLENLDEFDLDPSTAERSSLRSSLDSDEKSDVRPLQRTVGFEDEIADWTARNQAMERDDDAEADGTLESEILVTDPQQHQQRSGSVPCPSARWAKINNNRLYAEHRPAAADPFLNSLSRSRSAEYNRYFD